MKKRLIRAAFAACLLGTTVSFAAIAPAVAQAQRISNAVAKPLMEAQKMLQAQDFQGALAKAREAQAIPGKTAYDSYKIEQFIAVCAINMKDYPAARAAYEAMVTSPAEDAADKTSNRYNMTLLASEGKDYAKSIQYGEELATLTTPDAKIVSTVAQAYYFTDNHAKSEEWALKGVEASRAAGQVPDQGTLSVLLSAQAKLNKQADAARTLELLATHYGSPNDWSQLIDLALGTPGIQNPDGIDLYRLRVATNAMLDPDDYSLMATIALQLGFPGEAKIVLDEGRAKGKTVSPSQYASAKSGAAQDAQSLAKFAKDAEARAKGDYDEKLAETYYGYGRYGEAETVARRALSKGGTKDGAQAQMVLAMSLARQGKYQEASDAFKAVKSSSAARLKAAHLWTLFCTSKLTPATTADAAE